MASAENFHSFAEFWPFYLSQHSKKSTRVWHCLGTLAALTLCVALAVMKMWVWLPVVLVVGYGPAWISHFFLEKNRPATFRYPVWSLLGDMKMFGLALTCRLEKEVQKVLAGR